jgi:hypothetical protein
MREFQSYSAFMKSPAVAANVAATLAGGLWLAWLGYWKVIFFGLDELFIGNLIISFAVAPAVALLALAAQDRLKQSLALVIFTSALSIAYAYTFMAIWAVAVFWGFLNAIDKAALLPVLLWSYSSATAPWNYMASAPGAASGFKLQMACVQTGSLALAAYCVTFFPNLDLFEMPACFVLPILFILLVDFAVKLFRIRSRWHKNVPGRANLTGAAS